MGWGSGGHNSEVFHLWAHQTQDECLRGTSKRNYWFSGKTLYSYETPIARLMSNGKVLHNTTHYSNTTSGHQSSARVATNYMPAVYGLSAGDNHHCTEESVHCKNREAFDKAFSRAVKELLIHPKRKITLGREIHSVIEMREAYRAAFDLDWPALDQTAVEVQVAEAAELARAREVWNKKIRGEEIAARMRSQEENLERWRAGENPGCRFEVTALRLARDKTRIETTHGAQVPVGVAPSLWKLANRCRATGATYHVDQLKHKVGFYELRRIEADGTLIIGCHTIPYEELVPIAEQLGFTQRKQHENHQRKF